MILIGYIKVHNPKSRCGNLSNTYTKPPKFSVPWSFLRFHVCNLTMLWVRPTLSMTFLQHRCCCARFGDSQLVPMPQPRRWKQQRLPACLSNRPPRAREQEKAGAGHREAVFNWLSPALFPRIKRPQTEHKTKNKTYKLDPSDHRQISRHMPSNKKWIGNRPCRSFQSDCNNWPKMRQSKLQKRYTVLTWVNGCSRAARTKQHNGGKHNGIRTGNENKQIPEYVVAK